MRNYLEDLVEKCKTNSDLFDKEFPTYLGKSLLEIPGINDLVMTKSEFKLVIPFYGTTRSVCTLYYAHSGWNFLLKEELRMVSKEIENELHESLIERTIFNEIATLTHRRFVVRLEKEFSNPEEIEPYPPISIHVFTKLSYHDYTLKTTSIPKWNGQEYEYFIL